MASRNWTIPESSDGARADACARRALPEMSAAALRECFRRRDVKVDGVRVRPEARVRAGQTLTVYYMESAAEPPDIVYEDADALLINKRAGLSVEADGRGVSLEELVCAHVRAADPSAMPPKPCHRLDNQTSGLILFAKNPAAQEALERAFRERTLDKRYICLVRGEMKPPAAVCRAYLIKDAEAARVRIVDAPLPGARPIVTGYETLEAGPVSRLRVHLITGRTHQIRAHLAALGHPLLGDDVYGDRAFNRAQHSVGKLCLCAASLTLETGGALPQLDGKTFEVKCPF